MPRVPGVVLATRRLRRLWVGEAVEAPSDRMGSPPVMVTVPTSILAQYLRCCGCHELVLRDYAEPCDVHEGESLCLDCIRRANWC